MPLTRFNISSMSFTSARLNSLKAGVAAMKLRPITDPTSWLYQANMHQAPSGTAPLWNGCQHYTPFFLAWHRMYLYYFERILRQAANDPSLTLPYWNYSNPIANNPTVVPAELPAAFKSPASSTNSLFHANRLTLMNSTGSLNPSTLIIIPMMAPTNFASFQSNLEGGLHNSVHSAVGGVNGDMSYTTLAARDPIFWLHHCNIDRLWGYWLRLGTPGACRKNPVDAAWLNKKYAFYDENKKMISMTVKNILDAAAQLDYIYEEPGPTPIPGVCQSKSKEGKILPVPIRLDLSFNNPASLIKLDREFMEIQEIASKNNNTYLELVFEDALVERNPEAVFEVFVSQNQKSPRREWITLGMVSFFGARLMSDPRGMGTMSDHKWQRAFDLSGALGELAKRGLWDGSFALQIIPVFPLNSDGKEAVPRTLPKMMIYTVKIRRVDITVEEG
jgi:hypothetical protein